MPDISEKSEWRSVPLIDSTTIALGGDETVGPNIPNAALAHRTDWLKSFADTLGYNPELNQVQLQETIRQAIGAMEGGTDQTSVASIAFAQTLAIAAIAQGRLTLVSENPVPLIDELAKTILYYTPYKGNLISLYNPIKLRWEVFQFNEIDLLLTGFASNKNYDVFIWNNAGILTLEAVAWNNSDAGTSERASLVSRLNGIWVKTSDKRRYLGTIRTTATTGQCEDSLKNRFVFNAENKIERTVKYLVPTTSWTYQSATKRQWNADPENQVNLILGQDAFVKASVRQWIANGSGDPRASIGVNGFTDDSDLLGSKAAVPESTGEGSTLCAEFCQVVSAGYNELILVEWQNGSTGTTTRQGNGNNGIIGSFFG